jgi:phospholipid/cholesterol/gamma-HCH transport system permease protein
VSSLPVTPAPAARLDAAAGRPAVLLLSGAWRLGALPAIQRELDALKPPRPLAVDGSSLSEIDTAAALSLFAWLQSIGIEPKSVELTGFDPSKRRLMEQVQTRFAEIDVPTPLVGSSFIRRVGRNTVDMFELLSGHVQFLGAAAVSLAQALRAPRRLRLRELTAQLEQVCLNAIPVVALVTLLIGIVIAYLLGLQAEKYGANIFVVDGVGIGATREFAPIIVAVIMAGRSGASFTAQLGSMRLTEETDAIRTLGLSPIDVLVLPRLLALMLAMPLLVFVGDVMSLTGALLIADPMLGITPAAFLARLHENLDLKHVYVGLTKAPVFALAIAVIGCRMGMTVDRDTRALGMATTSTVVQSIVAVILLDAAFAVFFQELDI